MIHVYDTIAKKRHGLALNEKEIRSAVSEYTGGSMPDYQMAALLMAICCNGMNAEETAILTDAIASSGDTVDLSRFGALSADKHSTGGVGDKTTLIVAPLAAALGCKVAKMSGRGLGHTGGTVDKLESFPGFKTSLSPGELLEQVEKIGVAVTGQSGNLAPADKKIYALRDVTATVDSIPLIASSIMGKKLASGSKSIVLDVKYGSGSFMKAPEDAQRLAEVMINIGESFGRRVGALITDMNTPLGYAVGNILEIKEAVNVLRGNGPRDLYEVSVALAAQMAHLALDIPYEEAHCRAENAVNSGIAYKKFIEWISAQGGNAELAECPEKFPQAKYSLDITVKENGFIYSTDAEKIGLCSVALGAGRHKKDDCIDYTAGILLHKKAGDEIKQGDKIATLFTSEEARLSDARDIFLSAITSQPYAPKKNSLIYAQLFP